MEEWGSGYKRVIHACQADGYLEPDWEELGTAFRVIFHSHPAVLEHSRTEPCDYIKRGAHVDFLH